MGMFDNNVPYSSNDVKYSEYTLEDYNNQAPLVNNLRWNKDDQSFLDNIGSAFKMDNSLFMLGGVISDAFGTEYTPQLGYQADHEDNYKDLPDDLKLRVEEAVNPAEYKAIVQDYVDKKWEKDQVDNSALGGFIPYALANIADPLNLVYGAGIMMKGSRGIRALKGMATEGSIEGVKIGLDSYDAHDSNTLVLAMALGGVFNAVGKGAQIDEVAGVRDEVKFMLQGAVDDLAFSAKKPMDYKELSPNKLNEYKQERNNRLENFVFKTNPTMEGFAARSEVGSIRKLGADMFTHHSGNINTDSVQSVFSSIEGQLSNHYNKGMAPIYKQWAFGDSMFSKVQQFFAPSKYNEFNDHMGDVMWRYAMNNEPLESFDPLEQAMIKHYGDNKALAVKLAGEGGHPAFKKLVPDNKYVPVVYSPTKLTQLSSKIGRKKASKAVQTLFYKAIEAEVRNSNKEFSKELTTAVSRGMVNKIFRAKVDKAGAQGISFNTDEVAEIMSKHKDFTEDQILDVVDMLQNKYKSPKKSSESYANYRTLMDRTAKITLDDGTELGFSDIVDTSMETLVGAYNHKVAGRTALHSKGYDDAKIAETLKTIESDLKDSKLSPTKQTAEMTRAQVTFDYFRGYPTSAEQSETHNALANVVNNITSAKLLGQTAFTMSSEVALISNKIGWNTLLQGVPAFKAMVQMYTSGKMSNEMFNELYDIGLAGDILSRTGTSRFNFDASIQAEASRGGSLSKAETASMVARDITLHVGGIKPLTTVFDLTYGAGVIKAMSKIAHKTNHSARDKEWLKEFNFTKEEVQSLTKYMDNGKLRLPLLEKNPELYNKFVLGLKTSVDRTVQKTDFSSSLGITGSSGRDLISNTPIGKVAFGLQSYAISSYSKQLGHLSSRRDGLLAITAISQVGLNAISYMSQTALNSGGNQDYMKEHTQPIDVLEKAITRATFASYMPNIASALTGTLKTGDPLESLGSMVGVNNDSHTYGNNSGIANLGMFPANSVLDSVGGSISGLWRSLDGDMTSSDFKALTAILPNFVIFNALKNMELNKLDKY